MAARARVKRKLEDYGVALVALIILLFLSLFSWVAVVGHNRDYWTIPEPVRNQANFLARWVIPAAVMTVAIIVFPLNPIVGWALGITAIGLAIAGALSADWLPSPQAKLKPKTPNDEPITYDKGAPKG